MIKLSHFVAFLIGAGIGGTATYIYTTKKYESIIQDEIASVKKVYSLHNKIANNGNEKTNEHQPEKSEEIKEAQRICHNQGYIDYSSQKTEDRPPQPDTSDTLPKSDEPYIISCDELGNLEGYDVISLTYYADGVLTDEDDFIVDDIEGTVGVEALDCLSNGLDSAFVRNDKLKCDYEILKVYGQYTKY